MLLNFFPFPVGHPPHPPCTACIWREELPESSVVKWQLHTTGNPVESKNGKHIQDGTYRDFVVDPLSRDDRIDGPAKGDLLSPDSSAVTALCRRLVYLLPLRLVTMKQDVY